MFCSDTDPLSNKLLGHVYFPERSKSHRKIYGQYRDLFKNMNFA